MALPTVEPVAAVYELREAAVEHGKALAATETSATSEAVDHLIATTLALEEKTAAAIDECADSSQQAVREALEEST